MKQKNEECDECNHNTKDMKAQREMLELNVLDMQIRQLEQQAMLVEQQIQEQSAIILDLEELKKAKKSQNALFPFSRDIFIEGKIENPDSLLVHIGSKVFAKKSIDEAKRIVDRQKQRLLAANEEIAGEIEKIMNRINELENKLNH